MPTPRRRHFRSLAEYAVAIKNVHYSKGTLLDYDGVMLSEGGWPQKAYADAAEREASRGKPWPLNYASSRAPLVGVGAYDQHPSDIGDAIGGELIGVPSDAIVDPSTVPPSELPPPVEAADRACRAAADGSARNHGNSSVAARR